MTDVNDPRQYQAAKNDPRRYQMAIRDPRQFEAARSPEFVFEPPNNPLVTTAEANRASEFHRRLVEWINSFSAGLDEQHEVGVRLVSFGQTLVFRLDDLGYWNPSLICFYGETDDGNPVELIQHVSQISVLLMKVPRKDPSKPKQPIGFHATEDQAENKEPPESAEERTE